VEISDAPLPDDEIGALVAKGRDADVFALRGTEDRVVRRLRRPFDLAPEAAVMEHVRAAGYPVPRVWRVGPGEMVLDRVRGATMADDLARRPWRASDHGRTLARLHTELHAVAAPADLRPHPVASGDVVLHLDLHPQNVMLTDDGPVVIDWSNARRGPGAADVADVWVVLACLGREPGSPSSLGARLQAAVIDRVEPLVRRRLLDAFLAGTDRTAARALLGAAAEHRLSDQNVRPHERERIEALIAREA
jgi:aminoglycoside phosphotransferase (APT) family kinase protein